MKRSDIKIGETYLINLFAGRTAEGRIRVTVIRELEVGKEAGKPGRFVVRDADGIDTIRRDAEIHPMPATKTTESGLTLHHAGRGRYVSIPE